MELRPSRNQGPHGAARTALNKTRPQPGDGVSAFLCHFLDDHGVKPVKVFKKACLCHETQADWHSCDEVHASYMATWPFSSCPKHFILIVRLPLLTLLLTSNSLSLILTLTLVRPESFLCLLFSRSYMQSLRKYESEGKLLDSICLGHTDRVLEYRDSLSCGESRYQRLPKGHVYVSRLKFG
jgi:hypothetical protein